MLTHDKMVAKMLSDPEVKAAYDALEDGLYNSRLTLFFGGPDQTRKMTIRF